MNWVQITDVVQDIAEDPVLQDASDLLADQAAATKEMILWGVLRGGSQVVYANGSARTSVNTPIDSDLFAAAVNTLKRNHAKMITKVAKAGPNIATEPVGASYVAFGHVDLERDLRQLSDFVPTERYASGGLVSPWEIGKVTNVRIILSPDLPAFPDAGGTATGMRSTTGTLADVYPLVLIGEDFFGDLRLAGMETVTMRVQNPGTASETDPLAQRGFVSWKTYYAAVRLNELWGVRIEAAVTALS
jgi:N4-gp56 family major capsid protein